MGAFDALEIPSELLNLAQYSPLEDFVIRALAPTLEPHGFAVLALIEDEPTLPFVQVRRLSSWGYWGGDPRGLLDRHRFAIQVFTEDPDGDQKGALYSEIVRAVLQKASDEHWSDPEIGIITNIKMTEAPNRVSDWATSQGPVQYADLPVGTYRYESQYSALTRPPSVL